MYLFLYLINFIPFWVQVFFNGLGFEIAVADSEFHVWVRLAFHQTHHVRIFGHQVSGLQNVDPHHPLRSTGVMQLHVRLFHFFFLCLAEAKLRPFQIFLTYARKWKPHLIHFELVYEGDAHAVRQHHQRGYDVHDCVARERTERVQMIRNQKILHLE